MLLTIPKLKIIKGDKNIESIIKVFIIILLLAFLLILFVLKYVFTFFLKDFENLLPFALENFGCSILSYFKLIKYRIQYTNIKNKGFRMNNVYQNLYLE